MSGEIGVAGANGVLGTVHLHEHVGKIARRVGVVRIDGHAVAVRGERVFELVDFLEA